MRNKITLLLVGVLFSTSAMAEEPVSDVEQVADLEQVADVYHGEDMIITTGHKLFPNTLVATPSFKVDAEEINKVNLITASDAIKLAPSVQVRRRFYGDTNGVTAIRGSTNFQTNHFNMYVDGLPLHNPVQTKWNGAPKWNLIAPNAIHSASVLYGPYSAEHRGAFGGTFDLKTKLPDDFEMSMDVTGLIQDSRRFGQNEILGGHKEFISAGNRWGDWSVYAFFNHLENEGQPQSFVRTANPAFGGGGPSVFGASGTTTEFGDNAVITGDDGINNVETFLYQLKVGYDFNEDLRALFTFAFDDTTRESQSRSYIRDGGGNTLWGGVANQGGVEFDVNPTSFGTPSLTGSENKRETLTYGLNLSGKVTEDWSIDTTASYFDAYRDQNLQSNRSRNDPAFYADQSGEVQDTKVWWFDYSLKMATQNFMGRDDIGFMAGYQYNHSFLDIKTYDSTAVYSGAKGPLTDDDGGSTETHSLFMQADWDATDYLNLMAGLRYDNWSTSRGHVDNQLGGGELPNRNDSRVSPKASVLITPIDLFSFRYSFSKAYRFPVAEELFESTRTLRAINISDPTLKPETGYFHDFQFQYDLDQGYARATVFYNTIEDEILNVSTVFPGGGTRNRTRGIDQTETVGIELVYRQDNIMELPFDLSLNGTWIDKRIKKDENNPELEGKHWVRIPTWRANGTLTYHATPAWDAFMTVQYRSDAFGEADNRDTARNVFGAIDDYVLLNLKTTYTVDVGNDIDAKFSAGIDNLLNEDYYDHHPYPQRTYFFSVGLDI